MVEPDGSIDAPEARATSCLGAVVVEPVAPRPLATTVLVTGIMVVLRLSSTENNDTIHPAFADTSEAVGAGQGGATKAHQSSPLPAKTHQNLL